MVTGKNGFIATINNFAYYFIMYTFVSVCECYMSFFAHRCWPSMIVSVHSIPQRLLEGRYASDYGCDEYLQLLVAIYPQSLLCCRYLTMRQPICLDVEAAQLAFCSCEIQMLATIRPDTSIRI